MNTYSSTAPQSPSERKHSKRATHDCSKPAHNFRHCILPLRDIWAWMKTTQNKFTCTKKKKKKRSRSEPNFDKVIWQGMRVATKWWEKKGMNNIHAGTVFPWLQTSFPSHGRVLASLQRTLWTQGNCTRVCKAEFFGNIYTLCRSVCVCIY